ncbi:MAG TPA: hypothetical protein VLG12_01545 [Candidatus Saccharimonadales bacterium]|nr:hypothetical protein [Candidatus Saccharimonadales bacterium]
MRKIITDIGLHKLDYLLLFVIILISAIVRFSPLIQYDIPFLFDHGRDMLAVKQIAVNHKFTLIGPFTGLQGVFQSPLHFYLLTIPFFLSGGNPSSGTWMMATLALIGIFLCYIFGRKIAGSTFALILSLFFAFSPTSLAFSAHFWNPHWIPFLMIFLYFFLYKSIFVSSKFWPLTGLIIGLIAQFEVAFGIPLFVFVCLIAFLFSIRSLKTISFWLMIPVFLATFLPQMLFDIRHQFLMTKTILGFLHGVNTSVGGIIPFPTRFFYRLNEIQLATIYTVSDNRIVDYVLSIPIIIFLFSAPFLKMRRELRIFAVFASVPILFFLGFLFYAHEAWSWYWIGLQTSYYFLLAYVLSIFFQRRRKDIIFASGMIALFTIATILPEIIKINATSQGDTGTLKNELRVIDFIYRDANHNLFGEFVYTPPIYDYAYQYLFWWKGKQYGYEPTKDKNNIFYLIIEPDKERPYAIKGWKETVIKSGKILWDKTFPGGITVEKRIGKGSYQ